MYIYIYIYIYIYRIYYKVQLLYKIQLYQIYITNSIYYIIILIKSENRTKKLICITNVLQILLISDYISSSSSSTSTSASSSPSSLSNMNLKLLGLVTISLSAENSLQRDDPSPCTGEIGYRVLTRPLTPAILGRSMRAPLPTIS